MRAHRWSRRFVAAGATATVAAQIGYPLARGRIRDALSGATVLVFAATSLGHAAATAGWRGARSCAVAALIGLAAELLGVHTGVPFGRYRYLGGLGPRVGSVPLLVPLAWTMMAWPSWRAAARLGAGRRPGTRILLAAWALASWDLFLDPQQVADDRWEWTSPGRGLPGVPEVPLTNYAGWVLISAIMMASIAVLAEEPDTGGEGLRSSAGGNGPHSARDQAMLLLYLWTWLGSTLAHAVFLRLPASALWGGLGMGVIGLPLLRRLRP